MSTIFSQIERLSSSNVRSADRRNAENAFLNVVIRPSWLILAAITVTFTLPINVPFTVQLIPLLLSVILFGLPHGAADLIVPGLLLQRRLTPAHSALLLIAYLVLASTVLLAWWLSPAAMFVFFIAMTWWHWGSADLYALLTFHQATFLNGRLLRLLTILVRGSLPMILPLIAFPDDYQLAATSIGRVFGNGSVETLSWAFTPGFRTAAALTFTLLGFVLLARSYQCAHRSGQRRIWFLFGGETLLLALFFVTVPSFAAVGIYFCLWHSVQHMARVALLDPASARLMAQGQMHDAFYRFMKKAAPYSAVALVLLAILFLGVPRSPNDITSLVSLYLALIAALTLPHAILVHWMDGRQGVWNPLRR